MSPLTASTFTPFSVWSWEERVWTTPSTWSSSSTTDYYSFKPPCKACLSQKPANVFALLVTRCSSSLVVKSSLSCSSPTSLCGCWTRLWRTTGWPKNCNSLSTAFWRGASFPESLCLCSSSTASTAPWCSLKSGKIPTEQRTFKKSIGGQRVRWNGFHRHLIHEFPH